MHDPQNLLKQRHTWCIRATAGVDSWGPIEDFRGRTCIVGYLVRTYSTWVRLVLSLKLVWGASLEGSFGPSANINLNVTHVYKQLLSLMYVGSYSLPLKIPSRYALNVRFMQENRRVHLLLAPSFSGLIWFNNAGWSPNKFEWLFFIPGSGLWITIYIHMYSFRCSDPLSTAFNKGWILNQLLVSCLQLIYIHVQYICCYCF